MIETKPPMTQQQYNRFNVWFLHNAWDILESQGISRENIDPDPFIVLGASTWAEARADGERHAPENVSEVQDLRTRMAGAVKELNDLGEYIRAVHPGRTQVFDEDLLIRVVNARFWLTKAARNDGLMPKT